MANLLDKDRQIAVVRALAEASSIRSEVREHVRTNCSDFNREDGTGVLQSEATANREIKVHSSSFSGKLISLEASFVSETGIDWKCTGGQEKGRYDLATTEGGKAEFHNDQSALHPLSSFGTQRLQTTPQAIAGQMLSALLRSVAEQS